MCNNAVLDNKRTFHAGDYVVFALVLVISSIIGIYYAIRDARRSSDTESYLASKRKMHYLPVALSLTVSFMSAITILGTPAEVYSYGLMFWWLLPSFLIAALVISEIYIPIFYRLEITSTYEYLERRFSRVIRVMVTVAFTIETLMYVGVVIYAPALALSEATGFDLWAAVLSTGLVCTFYTTLGGLKAVIWTDVIQFLVMVSGLLVVIIRGSIELGGFGNIWSISSDGGRLTMNHMETDPRVRHSFWSLTVGGTFLWLGMYAVSQSQVQRYLCCRTERQSKFALFLNFVGLTIVMSFACMCGLVMYAYYATCDPITSGSVCKSDRILPYLVMDILQKYPGIPGIFVACVYSGSLSTISTGINAMACVTVEDIIKPITKLSDNTYGWVSRGLAVVFGLLCIGMAFLTSQFGPGVLQAALIIFGLVGGPVVGVYTLGMLFPCSNSWGAGIGLSCGLMSTIWIFSGAMQYRAAHSIAYKLPVSTVGCIGANVSHINISDTGIMETTASTSFTSLVNVTMDASPVTELPGIVDFYSVSYLYYGCIGFAFTFVIGLLISILTGGHKKMADLDPRLIYPVFDQWIFRWMPHSFRLFMRCNVRHEKKSGASRQNNTVENEIHTGETDFKTQPSSTNGKDRVEMEDFAS